MSRLYWCHRKLGLAEIKLQILNPKQNKTRSLNFLVHYSISILFPQRFKDTYREKSTIK